MYKTIKPGQLKELVSITSEQMGIRYPSIIEKDYYVTQIIHSLASIENEYFKLIFAGGTCLAKAHRLVKRMSEDVDFKVVFKGAEIFSKTRFLKILKEFRHQIMESISFPDISITNSAVRNEGKYMRIELTYPALFSSNEILRPHLLLEFTVSEARLPTKWLGINSIIEDTLALAPFSPSSLINCISINETAIEKWVSLTRRITAIYKKYDADDATLIRNLYDLSAIKQADKIDENFFKLAKIIVLQDGQEFKNQHPEYAANPSSEIQESIRLLKSESIWKSRYQNFVDTMVYEKQQISDYDNAIDLIENLSKEAIHLLVA